jgi:glycine dehydrogenase subunit 2
VYFPLIIPEAMMIEPTETEAKKTLDLFIQVLNDVSKLAYSNQKDTITNAPLNTSVKRIDDVKAARKPIISYRMLRQQD